MVAAALPGAFALVKTALDLEIPDRVDKTLKFVNRSKSLTGKVSESYITSRVVIDRSLSGEEIIPSVLNTLHSFVIGLITTALHLENNVTSARTVRDFLAPVQSIESFTDVAEKIRDASVSLESRVHRIGSPTRPKPASVVQFGNEGGGSVHNHVHHRAAPPAKPDAPKPIVPNTIGFDVSKAHEAENLPLGKVFEVELNNPNTGATVKVPVTVRLSPYYADSQTIANLIANYGDSLSKEQRRMMLDAGEITFWRDWIGQGDRIDKLAKDLEKDTKGELTSLIMQSRAKSKFRLWENIHHLLGTHPVTPSNNLANTIFVTTTDTMLRAKSEGAGDLHSYATRQKFFDRTFSLALVVIDQRHERIELYINSIKDVASYPYSTFSPKKGFNSTDMLKLMTGLAAGRANVF